jgi:hypothetical protein
VQLEKNLTCNITCNWKNNLVSIPLATGQVLQFQPQLPLGIYLLQLDKSQLQPQLQLDKISVATSLATEQILVANPFALKNYILVATLLATGKIS